MNISRKWNRACLACAVAGVVAGDAAAVHLSPDNTGQVLLYPYYTTRAGFVTSISVVNEDQNHTKAVKVRWREGKIGAPVFDINLFLPPGDVWTAIISDNGSQARITSADRSCTSPMVPGSGLPFVNGYYMGQVAGTFNDNGGAGLDRTREGYVEVIEMGVVANAVDPATSPATPIGNSVASAARHATSGTPANCALVTATNLFPGAGDLRRPVGGLGGQAIIINTATGTEFAVAPTALQHFFDPVDAATDLYSEPGSLLPDLTSVSPARSDVVVTESTGSATPVMVTVNDWVAAGGQPIDAVSAVLMKNVIEGEYDVSAGIRSETVVTMPTKRHHVLIGPLDVVPANYTPAPFAELWRPLTHPSACDAFFPVALDREEAPYATVTGVSFITPTGVPPVLFTPCSASSTIPVVANGATLSNSQIFASTAAYGLTLPPNGVGGAAPQYNAGWIFFGSTRRDVPMTDSPGQQLVAGVNGNTGTPVAVTAFDDLGGLRNLRPVHSDGIARRYRGLPMIGFTAINGLIGGQGYGGIFPVRSQTLVEP